MAPLQRLLCGLVWLASCSARPSFHAYGLPGHDSMGPIQKGGHDISQKVLQDDVGMQQNRTRRRDKPFYLIAHRVLDIKGLISALSHGANAVEIDMRTLPVKEGHWYADHDDLPGSRGDTAKKLFEAIRDQRMPPHNKPITFVWLDLKTPNACNPDDASLRSCSILGLRDLARDILEPAGVRVLYGFYKDRGKAFDVLRTNLTANEAINLDGETKAIKADFEKFGPAAVGQRVFSYGYSWIKTKFGKCQEASFYTCTELRQARGSGAFGKVFGWTVTYADKPEAYKLMEEAKVDGLIYGYDVYAYDDGQKCKMAAEMILRGISDVETRLRLAGGGDNPW